MGNKNLLRVWSKILFHEQKDKITCPTCSAEYVPEDLNVRTVPTPAPKPEPKKKDDIENIDDAPDDATEDDVISLDDQKEIEDSSEEFKPD